MLHWEPAYFPWESREMIQPVMENGSLLIELCRNAERNQTSSVTSFTVSTSSRSFVLNLRFFEEGLAEVARPEFVRNCNDPD
jgi:hypothetical protein